RSPEGRHFDWLLGDPTNPRGRLWTARVPVSSRQWRRLRRWPLEPIQPHRRRYLRYQGSLTGGRGTVRRVDEGTHQPIVWTGSRIVLELSMKGCAGRVELRRLSSGRWRARLLTTGTATGRPTRAKRKTA